MTEHVSILNVRRSDACGCAFCASDCLQFALCVCVCVSGGWGGGLDEDMED